MPRPRTSPIRFFASSHRIDQLAPRTRHLLLWLVAGLVLQLATGVALHWIGPGFTPGAIAEYYRGSDPTAIAAADPDPLASFGLGAETSAPEASELHLPRSLGTILEVAHFHLLAMPLAVFLLAHLAAMTRPGRSRVFGALAAATFVGALLDALLPFAIRFHHGAWAWGKLLAFLVLVGGQSLMATVVVVAAVRASRARAGQSPAGGAL